ncbi:alanine racemase, putative [Bodo saltans]|uniref:Alanine racemase, putative n=2 Tax=Bodo saltans TaxID=75058 RepID=A0A0S4IND2_BODSA|nr:alanine racemase, putative [Bodo saltans]|eukprot:CUE85849.1 alanine racemase, putative [Bodo saltans]
MLIFLLGIQGSTMNVNDAHEFIRGQIGNGVNSMCALHRFSTFVEENAERLSADCPSVFPLTHHRPHDVMYRCVALVQEIDTNLSLFQFRPHCPFSPPSEEEPSEYLDATSYFLVPVPGAPMQSSHAHSGQPTEVPKGRGVKRSSDDVPIAAGAAFETFEPEAAITQGASSDLRHLLNLPHRPLHDSMFTACIATCVGEAPQLCLNDRVEVFGFLRADDVCEGNEDEGQVWGWNALELPQGLVARITAVSIRRCSAIDAAMPLEVGALRQQALASLAVVCAGDPLAAEYLLLSLIASVVRRHDDIPIGDVPLYLQYPHLPTEYFSSAAQVLRNITPVGCVELSLKSDSDRLTPRMDHQRNILVSGALQVAGGTTLLVDPRGVQANDSLNEILIDLIHRQAMKVDYVYSTARVLTSNHVVIVADCSPTSLDIPATHVSCVIKVLPTTPLNMMPIVNEHHSVIRSYIAMARGRLGNLQNEDESLATRMADEMTETAQRHPSRFNRDALIHNNTFSAIAALTRARAASLGCSSPRYEDFAAIMELEASRCDRALT